MPQQHLSDLGFFSYVRLSSQKIAIATFKCENVLSKLRKSILSYKSCSHSAPFPSPVSYSWEVFASTHLLYSDDGASADEVHFPAACDDHCSTEAVLLCPLVVITGTGLISSWFETGVWGKIITLNTSASLCSRDTQSAVFNSYFLEVGTLSLELCVVLRCLKICHVFSLSLREIVSLFFLPFVALTFFEYEMSEMKILWHFSQCRWETNICTSQHFLMFECMGFFVHV